MSAPLALQPTERPGEGLRRVVAAEVGEAARLLASPTADRAEDLHQIRLATKRLRALWALVGPVVGERPYAAGEALLAGAGRGLSAARDAEAVAHAVALLRARDDLTEAERGALDAVDGSGPAPDAQEAAMADAVARLQTFAASFEELSLPGDAAALLRPGLRAMQRRSRRAWRRVRERGVDEDWHRLRRRSKALYFALRLIGPLAPEAAGRARGLKDLHRDLGVDHDLVVLMSRLPPGSPAIAAARRAQAPLRVRASGASAALFAERARGVAERLLPGAEYSDLE